MKQVFRFPPAAEHEWCALDEPGRRAWLDAAHRRFFHGPFKPLQEPGRTVVLDGGRIDTRLGFYCAIGEAVNGPGGYFGRSMRGFDDCLFTGFGLEYPYTIIWKNSALSRATLGSQALMEYLSSECDLEQLHQPYFEEGLKWFLEARAAAECGERTLFGEITELIRSVPERGGGTCSLILE